MIRTPNSHPAKTPSTSGAKTEHRPKSDPKPAAPSKDGVQGEGNYAAAREFNEAERKFVASGKAAAAARAAAPESEAERQAMLAAEEEGPGDAFNLVGNPGGRALLSGGGLGDGTGDGDGSGDLPGLTSKLDYVKALGVDGILLLPVFADVYPISGGYGTVDYGHVTSDYGGDAALDAFVDAAHGHGLKVVLDLSFTLVADQHGNLERQARVERGERPEQRVAHRRTAQLEHRLVGERAERPRRRGSRGAHGAASSSSRPAPRACSARNDSFEEFSSRRRTR